VKAVEERNIHEERETLKREEAEKEMAAAELE